MLKVEEWKEFAEIVAKHIENYVVPQYGDHPDTMVENWDKRSIQEQINKYVVRIGTFMRGEAEAKRDALKIAHYACYLFNKLT